jgi:hypothetical protein
MENETRFIRQRCSPARAVFLKSYILKYGSLQFDDEQKVRQLSRSASRRRMKTRLFITT